MIDFEREVALAEGRIRPFVRRTPIEESRWLGELARCSVHLKLENFQATRSFKIRGAANKLLGLEAQQRERGVVAASTGNHGAAVAYLLDRLGCPGTIFLPETAARSKIAALEEYGVDLQLVGRDGIETERAARAKAEETDRVFVSPYNDAAIVAGQGTIGLELVEQLQRFDVVFIPVGGGGLAAGVAGYLKAIGSPVEVIGCQPAASKVMYESIRAERIVDIGSEPTLADGTAGGIESDSITFPICRDAIDDFILVSEDELARAIYGVLTRHHMLIEGAAALGVAALVQRRERFSARRVVVILTGARLDPEALRRVLAADV